MSLVTFLAIGVVALIAGGSRAAGSEHLLRRLRGKRVITCPETKKPAAVEVDAAHAAYYSSGWSDGAEVEHLHTVA